MTTSTAVRKLAVALSAATVAVTMVAAPASAEAPKFRSVSAAVSGSSLVVSFREIGLGNADIDYTLTGSATSEYGCVNGGSKRPSAANKTQVTATVSDAGTFTPKNGVVNGRLVLTAPGPGSFTCPPGQTRTFFGVTYTNIVLTDTTNDVTARLAGPFTGR